MRKRNERNDSCIIINYTENSTEIMTSRGIEYRTIIFFVNEYVSRISLLFLFTQVQSRKTFLSTFFSIFKHTSSPTFQELLEQFSIGVHTFLLFLSHSHQMLRLQNYALASISLVPFFFISAKNAIPSPFLSLFVK